MIPQMGDFKISPIHIREVSECLVVYAKVILHSLKRITRGGGGLFGFNIDGGFQI